MRLPGDLQWERLGRSQRAVSLFHVLSKLMMTNALFMLHALKIITHGR